MDADLLPAVMKHDCRVKFEIELALRFAAL